MKKTLAKRLVKGALRFTLEAGAVAWPRGAGALALRIFSTPRKGKLAEGQYPWLDAARADRLAVGDSLVQVYHWPGPGPRVLLLHGWESNTARWEGLLALLQQARFDVMAIDAPAHGYSGGELFSAVYYAHFLQEVARHWSPAALVGHSAGGMAAVYGLTQLQGGLPTVQKLALLGVPADLGGLTAAYQSILGVSPRVMHTLTAAARRRYGFALADFSIAHFARSLQMPGLVIHDRGDILAGPHEAEAIHQAWPGSRLLLTEGLGHSVQSEEVWTEVTHFLGA